MRLPAAEKLLLADSFDNAGDTWAMRLPAAEKRLLAGSFDNAGDTWAMRLPAGKSNCLQAALTMQADIGRSPRVRMLCIRTAHGGISHMIHKQ
ncbi:MAG: hypothetical protein Q4E91_00115 [Lachnospiraceae bacterium]|nr:hypothetical protein [Lachnospiraceae bacterium]